MAKTSKKTVNKFKYDNASLQNIEDTRSEFLSNYKKHDIAKKIILGAAFLAIVVAFVLSVWVLPLEPALKTTLQIGLPILILVCLFVYGGIEKKSTDKKMRGYFKSYYKNINDYTLSNKNIKNVVMEEPGKISKEEFIECGLYKDVFEVGSRGLTSFTYNKIPMSVCDCAGQVKGNKRVTPAFVGKYLRASAHYASKEPIIIYLTGTGLILPPTNIEDKAKVVNDKQMVIYTNSKNWKKVVTPKVMKLLKAVKTNELLVDLTISIQDKKQYICMGYNDPLMIPPLEQHFDPNPTIEYKKELAQILAIMEALH